MKKLLLLTSLLLPCVSALSAHADQEDERRNHDAQERHQEYRPSQPVPLSHGSLPNAIPPAPVYSGPSSSQSGGQDQGPGAGDSGDGEPRRKSEPLTPGMIVPDFGINLTFNSQFGGGDVMAGVAYNVNDRWQAGLLMHYRELDDGGSSQLRSNGLFLTFGTAATDAASLQFRVGTVDDTYSVRAGQPANLFQQPTPNGRGGAVGMGLVIHGEGYNFHVLDVERHYVGGGTSNFYSVSAVILVLLL